MTKPALDGAMLLLIQSVPLPVLLMVNACCAEVLTSVAPKFRLVVDKTGLPASPLPESDAVRVGTLLLFCTVSAPVRAPPAVGLKATARVQLEFAASDEL